MFSEELYTNEAMTDIYKIESPANHNFSGTNEHPNISENDYKIFDNYLKNNSNLNLKILLGGLSLLAYGFKDDRTVIINHIKNNSLHIKQQIDKVIPDLWNEYDEKGIQYYNKLLNSEFSYKLINTLDIAHPPRLSQKYYYGLKYLLLLWATNCYDDFEKWYKETERKDLLLYFIATILESHYIYNAKNKNFTNSKINWLRCLNNFVIYPISNTFPFADKDKKVSDIITSAIPNKEKLDLILYYLFQNFGTLTGAYDEENKEQFGQLIELLKKLDINDYFTLDYLKNLNLWIYKYYIVFEIIANIEIDAKDDIFKYILRLIDKSQEKDVITINEILLANLYGRIIINLPKNCLDDAEKNYSAIKRNLSKPYFYSRKHDKWNRYIAKAIFYTIMFYTINYPDKTKCAHIVDDFLRIKKGLRHYLDKEIDGLVQNLQEQLKNI